MDVKISLVLLLFGVTCASAYYYYGGLDDDYYNRGYRVASYGYGAPASYGRYYLTQRSLGGYPSFNTYNYVPQGYGFNTLMRRNYVYEDVFKKKKK